MFEYPKKIGVIMGDITGNKTHSLEYTNPQDVMVVKEGLISSKKGAIQAHYDN